MFGTIYVVAGGPRRHWGRRAGRTRGFMRAAIVWWCSAFILLAGQNVPNQPLKPEAGRGALRAKAQQVYETEMARAKAGDCRKAGTTYDFNVCFGTAVDRAEQSLNIFESAIRDLLKLQDAGPVSSASGPAGPVLTPKQDVEEFDHLEQLWHSYLDAAGKAAFHQFDGGTGGPSFELQTRLQLIRNHLTELDNLYGMLLRL